MIKYMKNYMSTYDNFLKDYHNNLADPIQAGEVLAKLTWEFSNLNTDLVAAERNMSLVARDIESRVDENTGKPISSAKASVLADATEECFLYKSLRSDVQNTEQMINTLKTIAKLITSEFNNNK